MTWIWVFLTVWFLVDLTFLVAVARQAVAIALTDDEGSGR